MKKVSLPIIISLLLGIIGCSFDYEEGKLAEDLSETVPETVLIDFVQVRTVEGKPDYRVYGSRAEVYGKRKETVIEDVLFQDFNDEGEIVTEGTADKVLFSSETENAEMTGDLRFYNADEEVQIFSEYLFWNDADETLTTRETEPVTLIKENGTEMRGTGFSADGKSKTINFTNRVQGTWVEDDEEDENKAGGK